eukprot:CAMPEP_0118644330 /NCGR_PEP_ID=MMETSP0785-20121206/6887_1 /TAXON_ID=91992 /ORGANISM="Bolidomonas pacifica, Strain CCMP 1866" /LENGTH=259 /DNA_ID=CAMNT_0006536093 /DNA_START=54 /DNA_END=833 /DNA_ORIENTATION=+
MEDFIFHLKNGFVITKMPLKSLASPTRRVMYCDESGHNLSWRPVRESDYPSKGEYLADVGSVGYQGSRHHTMIPLSKLVSCQYSKEKFDQKEFFMRLVFEGHRNLDIHLKNKEDWEYCMDGFEAISKNRHIFEKKASFRPESMQEVWDHDNYKPVVWEYSPGKFCNVGCGNDWEDIFLISSCYGCLWSFLLAFYSLLLKGILDTDEKSTLLMMYFVFGLIFVALVGLAVYTGQMEVEALKKKKAQLGLGEDDELPDEDE